MILRIKNIEDKTDAELLILFRTNKDIQYLGILYNRYTALIYGVCLNLLKKPVDAEDAVMQIFEFLTHKINRYEIKEFRTWIHSVARNHCLQKLRKKNHEITTDFNNDFMDFEDITHLFNEQTDEKRFEVLKSCLQKLREEQRVCIEKFFFEEKSYADIVEELNMQLKSVKSYIQNGKRNLKICIERNIK